MLEELKIVRDQCEEKEVERGVSCGVNDTGEANIEFTELIFGQVCGLEGSRTDQVEPLAS